MLDAPLTPRVRFAPSPTGYLHVGGARTALFNWLFARQKKGVFILRIEDTDLERSEARYETQLMEDLKWLGLDWDEGPDVGGPYPPYRQSDKMEVYHGYAERLLKEQKCYYCFCTAEELERERQQALAEQRQPVYSGKCRKLDPAEAERRRAGGELAAIRLKIPEHSIKFHDIVRGDLEFPYEVIGDQIIVCSSGMPIYNYVVVIDDADMKITHVIRGDDHISNTPKQIAIYRALGATPPVFGHVPMINGPDGKKLSKRHGATAVGDYQHIGILPDAMRNFLALLGWSPGGDREILTMEELKSLFSLEGILKKPAVFDTTKLEWTNGSQHCRMPNWLVWPICWRRLSISDCWCAKWIQHPISSLRRCARRNAQSDNSEPGGTAVRLTVSVQPRQVEWLRPAWNC